MRSEQIDFLLHYNTNAPRYTSYPPANLFRSAVSEEQVKNLWEASNQCLPENLSFYFHIPFCLKRCIFCGCTSETLHSESFRTEYFKALHKEMDEKLKWINKERKISQIHFGGGTPTSVPFVELERLIDKLRNNFSFTENPEIAIEINPDIITEEKLQTLARIGFNRISYGIQDFNSETLKRIGREPSNIPVKELLEISRSLGFHGLNLDLVYGLPGQTEISFTESILKAIDANPDRVALFSYAHIPWLRAEQKILETYGIPDAREKIAFFLKARDLFLEHSFQAVGMDHFAHSKDSLAIASAKGLLHRNFQGYCTRETTGQVYAFGSSAISQFDNAYLQNVHTAKEYIEKISENEMTEFRVHPLSSEERILRNVIERLMCNNKLRLSENEYECVQAGFKRLCALEKEGLLTKINDREIHATELGSLVIRYLAMQLDPLMQNRKTEGVFSKTI